MDDNERNEKIAKIAGLVEGKDFWGPREHDWFNTYKIGQHWECIHCHETRIFPPRLAGGDMCCKPPPNYSESLNFIVPVVRGLDIIKFAMFMTSLKKRLPVTDPLAYVLLVDNPAQLLCEALVEAVGGKE